MKTQILYIPNQTSLNRVEISSPDFINNSLTFTLDTGASVSLIKLNHLADHLSYTDDGLIDLQGINDVLMPTIGLCKLNLKFGQIFIEHQFYIVNDSFPIKTAGIIGVDFLSKNKVVIDYSNGVCKIINSPKPIAKNITTPNTIITLPARSEVIIPVNIISEFDSGIIPKLELQDQVFISETLTNKQNQFVFAINLKETPVDISIPNVEFEIFEEQNSVQILQITKGQNRFSHLKSKLRLDHLNEIEKDSIIDICKNFNDLFFLEGDNLSITNAIKHKIPTNTQNPINIKPYRIPECHKQEINKQISDFEKQGIVKKSVSPWNAPLLVVPKKLDASGVKKWRVVVDFRKLNDITIGDAFPLPNITDILDQLGNSKYFTTLDLASGFHQVPMDPEDSSKTAFSTSFGHFEFSRMPFGLKGAPATFQRLMNSVLTGLQGTRCFVYIDDVVVYGHSLEDHNFKLKEVFSRLRKHNLKLHPDKCEFLRKEVQYLGHCITSEGIKPDLSKILAVQQYPIPETPKDIKGFLGLAGYYRKFIQDFSKISSPLTKLLKKNEDFIWTDAQQSAFENLKNKLINPPLLQYPDFSKTFLLTTDASNFAIGSILSQGEIGKDLPIAYASRTLSKPEQNFSTIEKELLAIVWSVQHFRPYLYGREFVIITDHRPLKWLENHKDLGSRLFRWRLKLSEYTYKIEYKKGKINTNADALSRIQVEDVKSIDTISRDEILDYKSFLNYSKNHIILNPNIIEKDNQNCKILVKLKLESDIPVPEDIWFESPELIHIPINSFRDPNYDKLFKQFSTLKEILIKKNIHEIKIIRDAKLHWSILRLMLRFIFKNIDIKIFIVKNKIIPDTSQISKILYEYHDSPIGGHSGIEKTLKKVKLKYTWQNMRKDIKEYIKKCKSCQINKLTRKKTKLDMQITTTSTTPFEKIFLDIVGPLPLSINGNKYLLTLQDDLSKYSLAIPMQTMDAETVSKNFVLHFISRFGMPNTLLTDQGTNFQSEFFKNLCKLLKIKKINSTIYHPETNGALERSHQTLKDFLKHFINDQQSDWDEWIHLATFTYNTSPHSSSKHTPFELIFGKEANLPSSLIEAPKFNYTYDDYISELKQKLQILRQSAKENLIKEKEHNKSLYDKSLNVIEFKEGDLVLLLNETPPKKNLTKKLSPSWSGPYKIISLNGNVNATIKIRNKFIKIYQTNLSKQT